MNEILRRLREEADALEADEYPRFGGHIESDAAGRLVDAMREAAGLHLADDEGAVQAVTSALLDLRLDRAFGTPPAGGLVAGQASPVEAERILRALDRYLAGDAESTEEG